MKTMRCGQLGGPSNCKVEFHADTWEDMKKQSMQHGKQMFQEGDPDHLRAMQEMKSKMQNPSSMQKWMEEKKKEFESLEEDK